jgi:hypothetical protein
VALALDRRSFTELDCDNFGDGLRDLVVGRTPSFKVEFRGRACAGLFALWIVLALVQGEGESESAEEAKASGCPKKVSLGDSLFGQFPFFRTTLGERT